MAENALARYEVLFLTIPTLNADDASTIETQFKDLISNNKGSLLSYEKWGKYNLAYEVKKHAYGIYFLTRFEIPATELKAALENLRQFFAVKFNEMVLRYAVSRLAPHASLEYKRPESMEDAPRRDADAPKKERYSARHESKEDLVEDDIEHEDHEDEAV